MDLDRSDLNCTEKGFSSLSMIVRNEATNLHHCLTSVAGVFDEIVIADTGSSDGTQKVAMEFGARVFDFAWCDDFSAARNATLNRCKGNWVFWLDADDVLEATNRTALMELLRCLPLASVAMTLRSVSGPFQDGSMLAIDQIRLFPRLGGIAWEGLIHEQIGPSLSRRNVPIRPTGIIIRHHGYDCPQIVAAKKDRNLSLLLRQVQLTPNDPAAQFHLGQALLEKGEVARGLEAIEFAYRMTDRHQLIFRQVASVMVDAYRNVGRPHDAWRVVLSWPKERQMPHAMLLTAAELHLEAGRVTQAEHCLEQAIAQPLPKTAAYDDPLICARARYKLGWLKIEQGRVEAARRYFDVLLADRQTAFLGHKSCGILDMLLGDFDNALKHANELLSIPQGRLDGLLLQAQVWLQQGDVAAAGELLEVVTTHHPNSATAWNILAQVHRSSPSTQSKAEAALKAASELYPKRGWPARHFSQCQPVAGPAESTDPASTRFQLPDN